MKNIAVITARSGSKGLPDKNIMNLKGKPLLAYSIEAAKESGRFDVIHVSTDSEEYAGIAKQWGGDVPFLRSDDTSGDTASSWDVVREVLENYKSLGEEFDTAALLQPTSPLRTGADIQQGYHLMEEKKARAVIGVCEMEHSPLWSNTLPGDLSMAGFVRSESVNCPRQQLPVYYRINGALYIIETGLLDNISDLYKECYAYIMPRERSVDIDTAYDFNIASVMLENKII